MDLKITAKLGLGFAFDVEKDSGRSSGFRPAQAGLNDQTPLLGEVRLQGFAAALRCGFVGHLLVIGGNEKRYEKELPVINRAWAISQMLIHDFGISVGRVSWQESAGNTQGNILAIKAYLASAKLVLDDVVGISNNYHIPRIGLDFLPDLPLRLVAAEALCLLDNPDSKAWLETEFLAGLVQRSLLECKGMAAQIKGNYRPLSNPADLAKQ